MGDYIQSNSDSSNLALYAGIGAVGAVGGAALAYRMTRDPKNGKSLAKGTASVGADVAEEIVDNRIGSRLGRLFGLDKLAESASSSAMEKMGTLESRRKRSNSQNQNDWIDKMDVLNEFFEEDAVRSSAAKKNIGNDAKTARQLIHNSGKTKKGDFRMSRQEALDEILLQNPDSQLTLEALDKHMSRQDKKDMKAKEIADQEASQKAYEQREQKRREARPAQNQARADFAQKVRSEIGDGENLTDKQVKRLRKEAERLKIGGSEVDKIINRVQGAEPAVSKSYTGQTHTPSNKQAGYDPKVDAATKARAGEQNKGNMQRPVPPKQIGMHEVKEGMSESQIKAVEQTNAYNKGLNEKRMKKYNEEHAAYRKHTDGIYQGRGQDLRASLKDKGIKRPKTSGTSRQGFLKMFNTVIKTAKK